MRFSLYSLIVALLFLGAGISDLSAAGREGTPVDIPRPDPQNSGIVPGTGYTMKDDTNVILSFTGPIYRAMTYIYTTFRILSLWWLMLFAVFLAVSIAFGQGSEEELRNFILGAGVVIGANLLATLYTTVFFQLTVKNAADTITGAAPPTPPPTPPPITDARYNPVKPPAISYNWKLHPSELSN